MPQLGERVADRYELVRELGHGGIGTVYLARDTRIDAEVALKVVAASGQSYQRLEARLAREARLSYQLGQLPGVVRALDWGVIEPKQSLYLALDLVREARPLDLRSGSLVERLERVAQAAEIVARLHERKVVHRDLKPDNFLVDAEGALYLSDFGIAKGVDDPDDTSAVGGMRTATGALLGTPMFMPMEQFESAATAGYAADIYSLGVMLFYALTGRFPFEGTNAVEVMSAQLEVRYGQRVKPRPSQLIPSVDPDLDRLCAFAIDIESGRRPARVGLFVHSLRLSINKLRKSGAEPEVERSPTGTWRVRRDPEASLELDREGFTTAAELRELQTKLGPERFESILGGPALLVHHERPLKGVADYQGRIALLRSRGGPLFVGRSGEQSDVVLALPTISTQQVRFETTPDGWEVCDLASRNGTALNDQPLGEEPRGIGDGDLLCLSRHVTFKFLSPASLGEYLLWNA